MVPLAEALDRRRFGGKAAQLARALAAGLPVPEGFALGVETAEAVARGGEVRVPPGRWAVRSSALDEDGAHASFAGQHTSVLHVDAPAVASAVRVVCESAFTPAALGYRARLGLSTTPRMAVVVQRMVRSHVAGVLFTRHPTTGARELVVEASWGLGEAVVLGLVAPDGYRMTHEGAVLERRLGHKDVEVVRTEAGTAHVEVDDARATTHSLDDPRLALLAQLARAVCALFEGDHDLEWAFDDAGALHLLQQRSITR